MTLLYKDSKDVITSVDFEYLEDNKIRLDFSADCG